MHFHDPFLSPGDPASDLPDPMEHASFCLLRSLYLVLEGSCLKTIYIYIKSSYFMENLALSNLVCIAAVIGLDVMHNYISFWSLAFLYSFSYTRSFPNYDIIFIIWYLSIRLSRIKQKISLGNLGCPSSELHPHVHFPHSFCNGSFLCSKKQITKP